MATNFPGSLDSLTNPSSGDTLASPSHSSQHANANDAIEALQAKVGVNGSAVTTSIDYKLNNTVVDLTSAQSLYNKTVINSVVRSLEEAWAYSNQAISGAETINTTTTTAVYNYTAASGNFTLNVRGDASTTLNSLLDVNSSITVAWAVTNGATARYLTAFSVDGVAQTVKWQGGSAPTSGNANSVDMYVFTILKTSATPTYVVLGSQTQFA
jgi:hypothetical protein